MKIKECFSQIISLLSSIDNKLDKPQSAAPAAAPAASDDNAAAWTQLQTEYAELEQQYNQLQQATSSLKAHYDELMQQHKQRQQENADLAQQITQAQQEASSLKTQLQQASENATKQILHNLKPWTDFQTALLQDRALAKLLLEQYSEEDALPQLIRLIAVAAQWEQVERVWDELKQRCDREKRPATAQELALLNYCVAAHNLAWHNRQAKTNDIAIGTAYDSKKHTRATPRGDTISAQWLPELYNAGGIIKRQALVYTE